jgi:hypothetical protein
VRGGGPAAGAITALGFRCPREYTVAPYESRLREEENEVPARSLLVGPRLRWAELPVWLISRLALQASMQCGSSRAPQKEAPGSTRNSAGIAPRARRTSAEHRVDSRELRGTSAPVVQASSGIHTSSPDRSPKATQQARGIPSEGFRTSREVLRDCSLDPQGFRGAQRGFPEKPAGLPRCPRRFPWEALPASPTGCRGQCNKCRRPS